MLFDDPAAQDWNPPSAVDELRASVAELLGEAWQVSILAYDDGVPQERDFISAALLATHDPLLVHISRHAGTNVVQVRHRDGEPVPFEDLAVAKGIVNMETLLASAKRDRDDDRFPESLIEFDETLGHLRTWTDDLPNKLCPGAPMVDQLRCLADEFAAKVFGYPDHADNPLGVESAWLERAAARLQLGTNVTLAGLVGDRWDEVGDDVAKRRLGKRFYRAVQEGYLPLLRFSHKDSANHAIYVRIQPS